MATKTKPKAARKARCINPDCRTKGPEYTRGLCEPCYRTLRYMIKAGKLKSIEEAEQLGLCKTPKPLGGKRFPHIAARKVNGTAKASK